ncbi:hypothetical protein EW145_g4349 [Phellinidium pouzarii]|uniref:Crinkler effector protein N-terminal domain-containing protein n=1 Tax=Phellinidium pouzarii TaxID=167371 RepID=A0A4S4L3Z8_9AGAM|nr:hypothetical protein EW145_g4349 [Phellinidium pouzarii]
MSGEILTLFCLIYHMDNKPSLDDLFAVEIANTESVSLLKTAIKAAKSHALSGLDAADLHLWKVNIPARDDAVFEEKLEAYMKNDHKILEDLRPAKLLYDIFPKQPDAYQLSIIIKEPSVYRKEEEEEEENEHYQMFRQIILTVQKKGEFSHSDEALNGITMWTDKLPAFVKVVEGKLNTKRDLPVRDKEALLREFDLSPNYDFGTSYKFTQLCERKRHGEELPELAHVMSSTGRNGGIEEWNQSLEAAAWSRFFFPVADYMAKSLLRDLSDNRSVQFRFGSQSWLWSMLLKVKGEGNASYPYTPKSDFSVWRGRYPSLLILYQARKPPAAAGKKKKKEAVIVVIYVTDDFKAHLHLFFEAEKGEVEDAAAVSENGPPAPTIFYTEEVFQLNHTPDQADPETVETDRLRFISRLYNLFGWIEGSLLPEKLPEEYQEATGVFKKRNGTFFGGKGGSSRGDGEY